MKKAIVILVSTFIVSFIIWVIAAVVYVALNNFPKELPNIFGVWMCITFMLAIGSAILWVISVRRDVIQQIKHYLNS